MKTTVVKQQELEEEFTYPCLVEVAEEDYELIVLAIEGVNTARFAGVVVHEKYSTYSVGYYSTDWYEGSFGISKAKITLEND